MAEILERINELINERDKMIKYLTYLHETNRIDLIKDDMGWVLSGGK